MNYSVLFPKILNNLPNINEEKYRYDYHKTHIKDELIFIFPKGENLWFGLLHMIMTHIVSRSI